MAETAVAEPDLTSLEPTSPPQKRKRGITESASPESRRSKRGAPTATMNATLDAANAAYMDATHLQQAEAEFNALQQVQQATAEHDVSDHASAVGTASAALSSMYPTIHVPQPTAESFADQVVPGPGQEHEEPDASFNAGDVSQVDGLPTDASNLSGANGVRAEGRYPASSASKPAVGSEEWHKQRKDNHKEVERRRRETINEGINELAKIVPGCEKNKGSILARAVAFITQLKENETQNIEKWTLEKLLTEQAIAELSSSNEKHKEELDRAYRELDLYKQQARENNLPEPSLKAEPGASST